MEEHNTGKGANFTRKHAPIQLIYYEEFRWVKDAFKREKQVQKWCRAKKEALMNKDFDRLKLLSRNYTEYGKYLESDDQNSSDS